MSPMLDTCLAALAARCPAPPRLGLVLGSGLGAFADRLEGAVRVPFGQLPGFPVSTVAGHRGQFVFGTLEGVPLAVAQGRVHYYEGYEMAQVVLPVRLLGRLGAPAVLLTNAAGSLRPDLAPGDFMAIDDHIASFVPSPLRGPNDETLGPRFPDLTRVYDPALTRLLMECGQAAGVHIRPGVYVQTPGPAYETPAEVRMYQALGGDCVGMSTACEAVAARHMGLRVAALSCVTNRAAGLSEQPLSHQEVQQVCSRVADRFDRLVCEFVRRLGEEGAL